MHCTELTWPILSHSPRHIATNIWLEKTSCKFEMVSISCNVRYCILSRTSASPSSSFASSNILFSRVTRLACSCRKDCSLAFYNSEGREDVYRPESKWTQTHDSSLVNFNYYSISEHYLCELISIKGVVCLLQTEHQLLEIVDKKLLSTKKKFY